MLYNKLKTNINILFLLKLYYRINLKKKIFYYFWENDGKEKKTCFDCKWQYCA